MIMRRYRVILLAYLGIYAILAAAQTPVSKAFVVIEDKMGQSDTLRAGDTAPESYEAPLTLHLYGAIESANPSVALFAEWRIQREYMDGERVRDELYLKRQDIDTKYIVEDDGEFTLNFAYSYRVPGADTTTLGDEVLPIKFSIDDSKLIVPNGFSPNGDGINDLFKVEVRSIVKFKMSIFNRWGEVIVEGDEKSLEYEGDSSGGYFICWDGTYHSERVGNGVYFIRIDAVGAGGKRYTRRSDINILMGESERR